MDCHASLAMTSSSKLTRYGETHGDVALDCFASLAMTTGSITMRHGEELSDVAILN
jgi:hypothetical protein